MTPIWVTIVVAIASGVAASVISVSLRSRHERHTDRRTRLLAAGTDFSRAIQASFQPAKEATRLRFAEPEEFADPEEFAEGDVYDPEADPDVYDPEADPEDYWEPATLRAFAAANEAVSSAAASLATLHLLLPDESLAIHCAERGTGMISAAVGSLTEIPRDPQAITELYILHARLEWQAFNSAVRDELDRVGRRLRATSRASELRTHEEWIEEQIKEHTILHGGQLHVLAD